MSDVCYFLVIMTRWGGRARGKHTESDIGGLGSTLVSCCLPLPAYLFFVSTAYKVRKFALGVQHNYQNKHSTRRGFGKLKKHVHLANSSSSLKCPISGSASLPLHSVQAPDTLSHWTLYSLSTWCEHADTSRHRSRSGSSSRLRASWETDGIYSAQHLGLGSHSITGALKRINFSQGHAPQWSKNKTDTQDNLLLW